MSKQNDLCEKCQTNPAEIEVFLWMGLGNPKNLCRVCFDELCKEWDAKGVQFLDLQYPEQIQEWPE